MIRKHINSIVIVTLALSPAVAARLTTHLESWQRVAPVGHSFTVLMPTLATQASRFISASDTASLPVATYQSVSEGKRYVVAAFFKSDRTPALSSFDNFMAGMEHSFRGDETPKALTFMRDGSLNGIPGKQYDLRLGEYSGVGWFLTTEKVFYALVVVGADESDRDVARFLSSFSLGEVNTDVNSSGVSDRSAIATGASSTPTSDTPSAIRADVGVPPEPWPRPVAPISGGVLNGKAITLARPEYPAEARANGDAGMVKVQILIDETGNVSSAEAVEGPSTLRAAAVAAALQSRFTPTRLMGQPIKVAGVIVYNFVSQ